MKLKLYLSLEEMRLLGYMTDRPGYEDVLREIARRKAIIGRAEVKVQKESD